MSREESWLQVRSWRLLQSVVLTLRLVSRAPRDGGNAITEMITDTHPTIGASHHVTIRTAIVMECGCGCDLYRAM